MAEITIPIADVDEAVANAKPGETVEVYATLKIKSDSEVVADISEVEKCEDMDEEGSMDSEDASEDPGYEREQGDAADDDAYDEPRRKMKHKGKGMGVIIMIGGPKKK
jgi:hypothetical protein